MAIRTAVSGRWHLEPIDTARVRTHNTSLMLRHLWEARELSRAELSRRTGMARSTISLIVHELMELGLVRESHLAPSGGGRPPIVLQFEDDRNRILGVELGHDQVSVIVTNLRGRTLDYRSRPHDVHNDPKGTLALIAELAKKALAQSGKAPLAGIGLAIPAPVDMTDPDRLAPRILQQWQGHRPGQMLVETFQVPVFIDNEANLGALAEGWWGAGQGVSTFAYIRADDGVGAGFVVDGSIYRGATGIAGEIGHTAIDSSGPRCRCGLSGCLEAMVGQAAILSRTRERLAASVPSVLVPEDLDMHRVIGAARKGDALAREVVEEAGRYLGVATANLLNLMNPSLVVFGGSLRRAGELALEPMRQAIRERALWTSVDQADVVGGELGEEDVALGAATMVLQALLEDPSCLQ